MEPKTDDRTDSDRTHKYPTRFRERAEAEASKVVNDAVPDTHVKTTNELPTQQSTVESGQEIKTETNEPNELEIYLTDRLIHGRIQEMNQFQQELEQRLSFQQQQFERFERTFSPQLLEERFHRIESNQLRGTEFLSVTNDRTIRLENAVQGLTNDVTALMTHMRSMIDLIQHPSSTQQTQPQVPTVSTAPPSTTR